MGEQFPVSAYPTWSSRGWHGSILQVVAATAAAAAKVMATLACVALPATAGAAAVALAALVGQSFSFQCTGFQIQILVVVLPLSVFSCFF